MVGGRPTISEVRLINRILYITDRAYVTDLNGSTAVQYDFAELTLTNAGVLRIGPDDTLILTNAIIHGDTSSDQDRRGLSGEISW